MTRILVLSAVLFVGAPVTAGEKSSALVTELKNPQSVAVGADGRVYLTTTGEKEGDGAVLVLDKGKAVPFATGLDQPRGIAAFQQFLFVVDRQGVRRIDRKGKMTLFVPAKAFPAPPRSLHGITADPESGILYVTDAGDKDNAGIVYRILPNGKLAGKTFGLPGGPEDAKTAPRGVVMDGASFILVAENSTGTLYRVNVTSGKAEKIADGFGSADGLAWDKFGRLFISDAKGGRVFVIPRPDQKPVVLSDDFGHAAGIALDPGGKAILAADSKGGTISRLPIKIPGAELDDTPLPLETALAFTNVKWTGWQGETPGGKVVPLRPIVLTHAGDSSNRVFLATQHGVIHVFPNPGDNDKDKAEIKTTVFLDIQERVRYSDNDNEEGFLGLCFHPQYKKNGEFFVFYTPRKAKLINVLSRFRVSKDDPNRADPKSEEELLRIERPFSNHDGGTICFGPDGCLYVALGDGGAANDPFNNAQNLKSLLGKILRIDVDRKDEGKNYAIPKDNPFVDRKDARPETWAYGLRNVWRMAFDKKTSVLWAADVGQNLYEEINLITKGGNYGWKLREGLHPFGSAGVGPRPDLIEPIWEYHHDIGKSLTGGLVYRGKRFPELQGHYVYGDYVTGRIWALLYDPKLKRVVANRPIPDRSQAIMSFGEDEQGEIYFLTASPTGRGIWQFVRPGSKKAG